MTKIVVRLNPDVQPTGSDLAVVNAARRSFNSRSEWEYPYKDRVLKPEDKRLIEFLARGMTAKDFEDFVTNISIIGEASCKANDACEYQEECMFDEQIKELLWQWRNTPTHDTPFNHCFISFEVKAPIFVARQLVKHEYLIMSEFSRRYITDEVEFYEPDYWRKAAPNKKQGSLEEPVDVKEIWGKYVDLMGLYKEDCYNQWQRYREFVGENVDRVAPEQARMLLPQSTMTEWTWSGTLGAFAKMCQLRLHPDAQYEARIVAEEVYKHLLIYYPVSAKALVKGPDVT